MSSISLDDILKAMDKLNGIKQPVWESAELDEFMKKHKDIRNVMMIVNNTDYNELEYIPTKYGNLQIKVTKYIEPDKMYFVAKPDDLYKPMFSINP